MTVSAYNPNRISGLSSDEELIGTPMSDVIEGALGRDSINGLGGNDVLLGKTAQFDPATWPQRADLIAATHQGQADGGNTIYGDEGDDVLVGHAAADLLHGDNRGLEGIDGTVTFNGHTGRITYSDVPEEVQVMQVTGESPGLTSDELWRDRGEGGGIGDKRVDYLYNLDPEGREGMSWDGGEIMHFDIGTAVRSGTVVLRDLDLGERVQFTATLDDVVVGSWTHTGTTNPKSRNDRVTYTVRPEESVFFDSLSIEALSGPEQGPLNKSTSFNVSSAVFVTPGTGHDTLLGGGGDDTLYGGYGDDLFIEGDQAGDGNDMIIGGDGKDTVDYSGKTFNGVPGNLPGLVVNLKTSTISVATIPNNQETTLDGIPLPDDQPGGQEVARVIEVAGRSAYAFDNNGDEVDTLRSVESFIGTDRQDMMVGDSEANGFFGGARSDMLWGRAGADTLDGGAGDDFLDGGSASDSLIGGEGADTLLGGSNNDRLHGGNGADKLSGNSGSDHLYGGLGDDTLNGGTKNDRLYGGEGADSLEGGDGKDRLDGNDGNDSLYGGKQNDRLNGGDGDDELRGHSGNDRMIGGNGDDDLFGTAGNDFLVGGRGSDFLSGGSGNDTFRFHRWEGDGSVNTISDLRAGDAVQLKGFRDRPETVDEAWIDSVVTFNLNENSARFSYANLEIDFAMDWMDEDTFTTLLVDSVDFL